MHLYIDESGSINNKLHKPFVIAIVNALNPKKLNSVYKRFVKSRIKDLKDLDKELLNPT